jgi:hypothetical protein
MNRKQSRTWNQRERRKNTIASPSLPQQRNAEFFFKLRRIESQINLYAPWQATEKQQQHRHLLLTKINSNSQQYPKLATLAKSAKGTLVLCEDCEALIILEEYAEALLAHGENVVICREEDAHEY